MVKCFDESIIILVRKTMLFYVLKKIFFGLITGIFYACIILVKSQIEIDENWSDFCKILRIGI